MVGSRITFGSLVLGMALGLVGCGGAATSSGASEPAGNASNASASNGGESASGDAYAARGVAFLQAGRCEDAIRLGFDPAIAAYQREFPPGTRIIGSRTGSPTDALLALAAASDDSTSAAVVGPAYSDTLYMRAYCLVEVGRVDEAAQALQRALEVIPGDVVYACEYGHILQERHDWSGSLDVYRGALENVEMLDRSGAYNATAEHPLGVPILGMTISDWRRRALRGIGFSLIEVGDLDGAEAMFRRVLEIDPRDERALSELQFIEERRREAAER